jgi:hypothetical protein
METIHETDEVKQGGGGRTGKQRSRCHSELMKVVSELAEMTQNSGIDPEMLKMYEDHLKIVCREYGISPIQAALFAQFLVRFYDPNITGAEIAEAVHCSRLELLLYQDDLEVLEKKELVSRSRCDGGTVWQVPAGVIEALKNGLHYKPLRHGDLSLDDFLEITEDFMDQREHGRLPYTLLICKLKQLFRDNAQLPFVQKMAAYILSDDSLCLLLYFCYYYYNYNKKIMDCEKFQLLFEKRYAFRETRRSLYENSHELLKKHLLIRHDQEPWEDEPYCFSLSDKTKGELFGEHLLKKAKAQREQEDTSLIQHKAIRPREMFYNPKEAEAVRRLSRLLANESFRTVQKRLNDTGLRTGFACLFSGGPGTGKTETVMQLARTTGRNIMKVESAAIIDSSVGESEKNIKAAFDRYRSLVKKAKNAPILFFNEADGLLTRRVSGDTANPSVVQMWNAMQNIILEEMENLDGIMIAATNLSVNLDKAFERRFLFKIEFEKPGPSGRLSIWRSMLPDLKATDAKHLSLKYDLSGAQIENIARKYIMESALSGRVPSIGELESFCGDELPADKGVKIGFGRS